MKFIFTDKKITVPDSVRTYAEKKVGKLSRYFKSDVEAFVVFSIEKDRNNVEITLHSGSMYYRASERTSDMYASIDAAVTSIERKIRKNKTRLEKQLRQGAFERSISDACSFVPEPMEDEFSVARVKRFAITPMTVDEAILQMNLLNHTFFVFRNQEANGAFSVVYKRKAGNYGLLEDADSP